MSVRDAKTTLDSDLEIQAVEAVIEPLEVPDLGPLCSGASGMAGHLLFLFNLTRELRAQHVVEIGLGGANSALAFLLALRETGGTLTSIDIEERPEARARIEAAGLAQRWRFVRGSSDAAVEPVRRMSAIDVLLIDGLHTYDQCRRDYFRYAPGVREGGYVLFHDSSAIRGVMDFTRELRERGIGGVNLDYCNGLFVFRRNADAIW